MAEAEGIPPTASVASVGPGINYVGDRLFAYSGTHTATHSVTPFTMIKYTSGSKIQEVSFQFFDVEIGSHQRIVQITLNGLIVIQSNYDGSDPSFHNERYHLTIPPFTDVEFLGNIYGATTDMYASMTGRAYDV